MSKLLSPVDSLIPALYEVENPSIAERLSAIEIGRAEIVARLINDLLESSDDEISLDDFRACLEYLQVFVEDPAMMLVNAQVKKFDTYEAAFQWFNEIEEYPERTSFDVRQNVVSAFGSYLDLKHGEALEYFHQRFNGHTVFVSDDYQISIGRYE